VENVPLRLDIRPPERNTVDTNGTDLLANTGQQSFVHHRDNLSSIHTETEPGSAVSQPVPVSPSKEETPSQGPFGTARMADEQAEMVLPKGDGDRGLGTWGIRVGRRAGKLAGKAIPWGRQKKQESAAVLHG
jgi:hypothetical protein